MTQIIAVVQEKGGTGKSTIATNLVGMATTNLRVALVDADLPQGTSASWSAIRLKEKPENLTAKTANNYQELIELVQELKTTHDLIVIDAPPRVAEITKAALIMSTLTLIPLGASAAEVWGTMDLLQIIESAKTHKSIKARILWNRFRASTRSAKELSETVKSELKIKQLDTKIGYRVAYCEALARGLTALEWTDKQARQEIKALGKEVGDLLKITIVR